MGNGAKAAQKRERNAKDAGGKGKSQTKSNEAAKSIICQNCKQAFFVTTRQPALEEHATNKHSKTLAECFPNFGK
ncbi:At2g23090 like protein [Mucidula mucida]|nr:At2g23090 like protein [Mucidula mucida]